MADIPFAAARAPGGPLVSTEARSGAGQYPRTQPR